MNFKSVAADLRHGFVGRDREAALLARYRREASEGHGRIVLISGEAGVGKSRLLQHFQASVESGRAISGLGRCVEFVQTPLGPVRELLQKLERRRSTQLDTSLHALVQRLTFERHTDTTAVSLPTGALFDSIDGALARCALRGTVVLTIEDVHWADRSTLGFLTYLADPIAKRRMLVVATYRSDELDASHPRLSEFATLLAKRSVSNVMLGRLDERSSLALIEHALPHPNALDPATLADIARRSQGNPFFADELVKHALETGPSETHELPLSIRSAVLARAALLGEDYRKILSLAAVLGERFSVDRLVSLCGNRRDDVLLALERARSLRLVYDQRTHRGEMMFRHALVQEVFYNELLAERVRPLHEAIAVDLERRHDRTAASVELAHHWFRAGDVRRAATYAEIAGDQAAEIGAVADAISYYDRALAARADDDAAVAGLTHKAGVALGVLGQLTAGIARLRRAGDLYWKIGELEGFASNASALGALLHNAGDTSAATELYHRAVDALAAKLPTEALDLLRARIAYSCVAALDVEAALSFLSETGDPIADPIAATQAYVARLKISAMQGDVDRWRAGAERALQTARRVGDDGSRLRHAHCQIALDAVGLGKIDSAREHFAAALSTGRAQYVPGVALASAASAFEHALRGDFATAATLLADAEAAPEQSYAVRVHVKTAQFVLGICAGDDARLRGDDCESFLHYGVAHGMKLAMGLLGGPYAWALGLRSELDAAAGWIQRMASVLPGSHRFLFAYLAAAQFGFKSDVLAMRSRLRQAAARPHDRVNKATLGLFDALAAQRGIATGTGQESALDAAATFDAIGWPWLAARAYEAGGNAKRALEIYRTLGALRDLRRLEVRRTDAAAALLSPRELEVAELVAGGHSNDEIAQTLHISLRTVEKHVSAALRKLDVRSRLQLGRLLTQK
ncbi:MAG TPA: AAA family ATPase [Candidatus Tumulicola sp.]